MYGKKIDLLLFTPLLIIIASISIMTSEQSEKIDTLKIKLEVINKMINMYPQLKKDKQTILAKIVRNEAIKQPDDYVLDKITIDNKVYYRDLYGLLLDASVQVVGVYVKKGNTYFYYHASNKIDESTFKQNIENVKKLTL